MLFLRNCYSFASRNSFFEI